MADLSTNYMGLTLQNPIIAGSSGLTISADIVKKLQDNGAAAIVMKSLYEEEIAGQADSIINSGKGANVSHGAQEYINYYVKHNDIHQYLSKIEELKNAVSIPVIASINCVSAAEWTAFAKNIESAGADGIEVNIFIIPSDPEMESEEIENIYFNVAREITKEIKIPVALKLSTYFSSLANTFIELSDTGIEGMVLFNRFHNPDINIEKMEMTSSSIYSNPSDIGMPLRWIGILSDKVECDIAASTGIHDGDGVIKSILAGAKATQTVTALYKNGPEYIGKMLDRLDSWMEENHFASIEDFRGRMSQEKIKDASMYERSQFMKYFSDHKS